MYSVLQYTTSSGPKSKQKCKIYINNNHHTREGHWELFPKKCLSFLQKESSKFFMLLSFCTPLLCTFPWCFGTNLESLQWKMGPLLCQNSNLIYLWQGFPFSQHKSSSSLMMSFPIMSNIKQGKSHFGLALGKAMRKCLLVSCEHCYEGS